MSMPSYWFDPMAGGGGGVLGGNAATGQPAMSSAQINASMGWNPYASFNPWANTPGGFGGQTAAYSALGAAYGRQVPQSSPAAVATAGGGGGGGQLDRIRALYGDSVARQYGWMPNEGAPAPAAPQVYNKGQFNPQTYGWDHNEGAAVPTFGMGLPNTQPPPPPAPPQQNFQDLWNNRGRVYQPPVIESPYGPGGYPAMEPATPAQQSNNTNWYGMPNASS